MPRRYILTIEARENALDLYYREKRPRGGAASDGFSSVPLPPGAFGDPEAMAGALAAGLSAYPHKRPSSVAVVVSTARTSLRVVPIPAANPDAVWPGLRRVGVPFRGGRLDAAARAHIRQSFPMGDDEPGFVFSQGVVARADGEAALMLAALPTALAEGLADMCRLAGAALGSIKKIEPLEYVLVRRYAGTGLEPVWLCLPQERSVRVISLDGGLPRCIDLISDDPGFRDAELTRCWYAQPHPPPARAVLLRASDGYGWLRDFLRARDVALTEASGKELPT